MAGLPTPLAIGRPFPRRDILVPCTPLCFTRRLGLDRFLRRRGPRIVAADPQPTFQLGDPQPLPRHHRPQLGVLGVLRIPQRRDLGVLGRHDLPQPRVGPAKPLNQRHLGHIGHSRRSSSLAGRDQAPRAPACRSTPQVSTTAEWTPRRPTPAALVPANYSTVSRGHHRARQDQNHRGPTRHARLRRLKLRKSIPTCTP
jgi:hypothetical protein